MTIKITIPNTSSDTLTFGSANTPTAAQIAGIDSGSSNGQLALYTTASGTSTERVRVDASGNVGIGTASPTVKLDVVTTSGTSYVRTYNGTIDFYSGVQPLQGGALVGTVSNHPVTFFSNSAERMRIDSSGNLLVGTTNASPSAGIGIKMIAYETGQYFAAVTDQTSNAGHTNYHLYSTGAAAYRFYVGGGGTIFATSTTISSLSDQRHKENIRDLNVGLSEIMALKPRLFDWKEGKGADTKNARGFIAQEFETVFPDLIDEWKDPAPEGEDPYKSVRAELIPVLVKAIQEQQALITQLQADVAALKAK